MTTKLQPATAKIYPFPAGGRAGITNASSAAKPQAATTHDRPTKVAAYCGAWYHDVAVEEEQMLRKH